MYPIRVAVLGAGNGGQAISADLSLKGFEVNLYNRSRERIDPILRHGGIKVIGKERQGFAELKKVTTDIHEALGGTDVIIVVVPAFAQRSIAQSCAPYLQDGQTIVLNPGRGGSLEFAKILEEMERDKDIVISETNTLTHGCRIKGPAEVEITSEAKEVLFSAFPAIGTNKILDVAKKIFPSIRPATNVLETCMCNLNAICHPAQMLLNIGPIETLNGDFHIYSQGTTPSVAKVIEEVDSERISVVKALGFAPVSFEELEYRAGGLAKKLTVYELMRQESIKNIRAPELRSRYLTEDVPYGLVPFASVANLVGVSTPLIDSLVEIASVVNQTDYWNSGRTVEDMGISDLSTQELRNFLTIGKL